MSLILLKIPKLWNFLHNHIFSHRLIRQFHRPLWFMTHAIKNKRCVCSFFASLLWWGGAQKHPNHDTNTHHTLWNQFPSFAKPDEEECREIWPRACDKRDQHIRCLHADGAWICHWCVKPRWPTQHCSPVSAGKVQLSHSGNSCCTGWTGWILDTIGDNSIRL